MTDKLRIFNIQKFSIQDGPGIRTTVFFKGCPLHCPWCSNPESQSPKIQMTWDGSKCINCRSCETLGMKFLENKNSLFVNREGYLPKDMYFSSKKDILALIETCPTGAISFEGEDMDIDKVMEKIKDDIDFYEESSGGVTLSGGEVLSQVEGAKKLLKKCKEAGISTAAETTCYAKKKDFEGFLENLDILLCDIKHYDKEIHESIVGGDFDIIYENIRFATKKKDLRVIGRIPVIPGFNFSKKDAHEFVKLIKDLGIKEVNLLPFHKFGENKYKLLRRDYKYKDMKNLDKGSREWLDFEKVFADAGLIK